MHPPEMGGAPLCWTFARASATRGAPAQVITHGDDVEIHALRAQGWSISAIARHLGLDRKTVRAHLAGEREAGVRASSGADHFDAVTECASAAGRGSPCAGDGAVRRGPEAGQWDVVSDVRAPDPHGGLRPECQACSPQRAHANIEHPPEEEIQWDWLEPRQTPWGTAAFVLVGGLSHSGRLRCWFSESMHQFHLVAGIHGAGAPRRHCPALENRPHGRSAEWTEAPIEGRSSELD